MYRNVLIPLLLAVTLGVSAQQQTVTLAECLDAAVKNHPLSAQNELYSQTANLQQRNIDNGKLPQLNLNAQGTYQNEVVSLPFSIPGTQAPDIPLAQYKVSMDVNQLIYGGGSLDAQSAVEDLSRQINQLNNDSELYKMKERVNQLYFSILLADLNADVISGSINDLKSRLQKVQISVREGVLLASSSDVLQAEILKAGQRLLEVQTQKQALLNTLQVLTGLSLGEQVTFAEPSLDVNLSIYNNLRPEYGVFALMQQKIEASKKLTSTRDMPKVYGFGIAGYGNPGYNMFKEGSALFYTVGAKVSWNFWNWNQTSREKQILDLNSHIVENQKNAYDMANRAQVQQYLADVVKAEKLLNSDDEIIKLRSSITRSAASQLENGSLTSSDYVTEQLAEEQALITRNLHKVQLLQAKALYKAATGTL